MCSCLRSKQNFRCDHLKFIVFLLYLQISIFVDMRIEEKKHNYTFFLFLHALDICFISYSLKALHANDHQH